MPRQANCYTSHTRVLTNNTTAVPMLMPASSHFDNPHSLIGDGRLAHRVLLVVNCSWARHGVRGVHERGRRAKCLHAGLRPACTRGAQTGSAEAKHAGFRVQRTHLCPSTRTGPAEGKRDRERGAGGEASVREHTKRTTAPAAARGAGIATRGSGHRGRASPSASLHDSGGAERAGAGASRTGPCVSSTGFCRGGIHTRQPGAKYTWHMRATPFEPMFRRHL
jgi:hypothetical protein